MRTIHSGIMLSNSQMCLYTIMKYGCNQGCRPRGRVLFFFITRVQMFLLVLATCVKGLLAFGTLLPTSPIVGKPICLVTLAAVRKRRADWCPLNRVFHIFTLSRNFASDTTRENHATTSPYGKKRGLRGATDRSELREFCDACTS
jgi:hypothetical protein